MSEPVHPVELNAPDITPYRAGNTGVDWVTTWDSGKAGPHVVVNALMHGNELCGAVALDHLFRLGVRPQVGRLTFAFANVAAYKAFDPAKPGTSRFLDEDMNRVWSPDVLRSDRATSEARRARELLPVFLQADALLDLHSMQNKGTPLTLCGTTVRGRALARAIGLPRWIVGDSGHQAGKRLIDHGPFADPDGTRTAILVECGQHWEAAAATVAVETTLRFLVRFGIVAPDFAADHRMPASAPLLQAPLRDVAVTHAITVETDDFRFVEDYTGMEVIPRAGTLLGWDGGREVRTPYDDCVLIMPSRRLKRGQTAVRLGRFLA